MNYGMRFVTLYRRQGSRPSPWKRNAKKQMAVWEGLTNSCEKKRGEKQRRKGKSRVQLAWGWCMGMTQRDIVGREVGGGFMFGNACKN